MGTFKNIAVGVLLISIVTFIALFGRLPILRYVINADIVPMELMRAKKGTNWLSLPLDLEYSSCISIQGR